MLFISNFFFLINGSFSIYNVPVYFIIGISPDGSKEVLDFVIFDSPHSESSSKWLSVLNSLKNRGLHNIIFTSFDGLPGLDKAVKIVFPNATLQKCIVHKLRNTLSYFKRNEEKDFIKDLKKVYNAPSLDLAIKHLELMNSKRKKYSFLLDSWLYDLDLWSSYFNFSRPIRKLIYTTNIIENFNGLIRQHISKKKVFFPKNLLKSIFILPLLINNLLSKN